METTLYFDLSEKDAFESLNGGARFEFPVSTFGEAITIRGRFAQSVNGEQVEVPRVVESLRAAIGRVDARPETGAFSIKVGPAAAPSVEGTNVTAALHAGASAAQWAAALNALSIVGEGGDYGAASVTHSFGSMLVTFAGEPEAVPIAAESNSLFPVSFLRVRTQNVDGSIVHDCRLIQAPVSFTDAAPRVVPPGPLVERIQEGGSFGEAKWPEIQKLTFSPDFRGVYQFLRNGIKSVTLKKGGDDEDGVEEIAAALLPLADTGGTWEVTNPETGVVHITAGGAMAGEPLDLLVVEIFDAPEGDLTFTLPLNSAPLAVLLRERESVTLPLEITAELQDPNDEETTHTRTLYRGEIEIRRELNWEGLAAAANIDWTRPPAPRDYVPFSPSQVSNGQLHWAEAVGNAVDSDFTIDHNLDTDLLAVFVYPNAPAGAPLALGTDYTFSRINSNSLEVSFLGGAPDEEEFVVVVLGLSQTSFFDPHTHPIPQVEGLSEILADLEARVADLEARSGGGRLPANVTDDVGEAARWRLPSVFEVYPSKVAVEDPETSLADLDRATLPKARGLFPAVHSTTAGSMPARVGAATADDAGTVLRNNTEAAILVPVGFGHSTARVKPGEYIASDGRAWYPVTQYGAEAGVIVAAALGGTPTLLNSAGHTLPAGTRGRFTTTGTLPAPLAGGTDYWIAASDTAAGTFSVSATEGGAAITLTNAGTGTHTFTKRAETSFYPSQFERTLFTIHVNENQLRAGKSLELNLALEAALVGANTSAQWAFMLELGEVEQDAAPALTGANLSRIKWRGTPILEQVLILSPVTAIHRFGVKVDHYIQDATSRFRMTPSLYGASTALAVPPTSGNFLIRGRLGRFDTENGETEPKGFVALKGFTFDGAGLSDKHGFAFIA